jgi:penicillin-binding protein 1A
MSKKKRTTKKARRRVRIFLSVIAGSLALLCFVAACMVFGYNDPLMDELFSGHALEYTSTLYYKDAESGKWEVLHELYKDENREWVDLDQIPMHTRQALIAIEDERFYEHNGVDWPRFTGALIGFLSGDDSYGGSTITQQLIKNLTQDNEHSWERKAREVLRALYVERHYDKDHILEYYLNTVYFNYRTYGIERAAQMYFGKSVSELTVRESASLAGLLARVIVSPTRVSPTVLIDAVIYPTSPGVSSSHFLSPKGSIVPTSHTSNSLPQDIRRILSPALTTPSITRI